MKHKTLLFVSLVLCAGFLASAFLSMGFGGARNTFESSGQLSGFASGEAVSYKITTSNGKTIRGRDVIDDQGMFKLPPHNTGIAKNQNALTYDIRIEREDGPLDVSFEIQSETGEAIVSAQGLSAFSNVKLENITDDNVTGVLQTKTDWAGVFRERGISFLDRPERLKLAFYGNIANDGSVQNPYIIEVQGAPASSYVPDIEENYIGSLAFMTEQFSAVMMYQAAVIGTFFDAKMQLETQRELQKLQATAHKDYHPSDQMCRFGTFVRTIAKTEEKARHDKAALNSTLMAAYTAVDGGYSSEGYSSDINSRIQQFREVYCDLKDNNNGLTAMCDHDQLSPTPAAGGSDPKRLNKDIDFARTVGSPFTLDINFTDAVQADDEVDVIALAKNLYWPIALVHASDEAFDKRNNIKQLDSKYMNARQLAAMQNIAHNSYIDIVSMKAKTLAVTSDPNGPSFMKALLRDFGLTDTDIDALVGEFPSYHAQMEVLTKKIYQDPDFYTNLYTKPANIDRISVSMDAIQLMQARDHYESSLRREMLTSLMVEEALQPYHDRIGALVSKEIINIP